MFSVGFEDLSEAPGGEPGGGNLEREEDGVLGLGLGAGTCQGYGGAGSEERGYGWSVGFLEKSH